MVIDIIYALAGVARNQGILHYMIGFSNFFTGAVDGGYTPPPIGARLVKFRNLEIYATIDDKEFLQTPSL